MDQEKIGKLIKKIRNENNLTQKDLAQKYGVTYQAVSKWENGKNIPDISLIKQMSKDFNIDIEDMLEGKARKKNNNKLIIITLMIIIFVNIFLLITRSDSFSFKTLSSKCANFNITGSIAYNNKKSSIYISDINYCGKEDMMKYRKIECTLYETSDGEETAISKNIYDKKESIKLDDYLKNLSFKVENYNRTCKKYTQNSLYLKLKTIDELGKIKTQKIQLSLNDNC